MKTARAQKPSIEEWLEWAEVVIARLTDCVKNYKNPPHTGAFMPDSERQKKTTVLVDLLRRIHGLVDQAETPSDSIPDVHTHDEQIVDGLALVFAEILDALPPLSADMQKLLKSPWQHQFPNPAARLLFAGDDQNEAHGIGSGNPEHGRLPEALTALIEREQMGDIRRPRAELLRQGEPRRHDADARQRWLSQNGRFRASGRVE